MTNKKIYFQYNEEKRHHQPFYSFVRNSVSFPHIESILLSISLRTIIYIHIYLFIYIFRTVFAIHIDIAFRIYVVHIALRILQSFDSIQHTYIYIHIHTYIHTYVYAEFSAKIMCYALRRKKETREPSSTQNQVYNVL